MTYDKRYDPLKRLMRKIVIDPDTGCWNWTGYKTKGGYGLFMIQGKWKLTHRFSYEKHIGPIAEGLVIDHLCRNRACANPEHIEPCTRGENTMRGETITARNRDKTHCNHGHEFTEHNTRIDPKTGHRCCKQCERIRMYGENDEKREALTQKKREWYAARREHYKAKGRQYAATRKAKLALEKAHATAPSD